MPSESLGEGFILTADGWLATTNKVIANLKGKYTVVGYQNKKYELSNLIEDKATGLIFGKINASGLAVVSFGSLDKITSGQTVIAVSGRNQIAVAHVKKIGYEFTSRPDLIQSSEILEKKIM